MKQMNKHLPCMLLLLLMACSGKEEVKKYSLAKTDKKLTFALDADTKNEMYSYAVYRDKTGKNYFTFKNRASNTLLFYDIDTESFEYKVDFPVEGNHGVGLAEGYYIHNLDSIYLPNRDVKEISLSDKNGFLHAKYSYDKDATNEELSRYGFSSAYFQPAEVIGRTMYLYSGPNRFIERDPVTITFDMDTHEIKALPFCYPDYPGSDTKLKKFGLETAFSRCYDGTHFVYSFYYDENIYVATPAHDSIRKIAVKSSYFDKVDLPGELTATPQDFCEKPLYGNLLYDRYRNVYYRIAYPRTTIEKEVRPFELLAYGRKNFSIIILDKEFNKIGETLFPDYTYSAKGMIILEDGLYISDSHYLNPQFSDDVLSFVRFELTAEK